MAEPQPPIWPEWQEFIRTVARQVELALDFLITNQDTIVGLLANFTEGDRLATVGWLPHPVLSQFSPSYHFAPDLGARIEVHYRTCWPTIRASFRDNLDASSLDDIAKEVMREAIELHDAEHFRAVPRLLFPEIERVARQHFERDEFKPSTSVKALRSHLLNLPLTTHRAGPQHRFLHLLIALESHIFEHVKTADALAKYRASKVPNRHACMHGLVDYNSFQSSLNMLILADYCFGASARFGAPQA